MLLAQPVGAESVRQLVFDNCDQALDQIALMPSSERQRIVSYLKLVLVLEPAGLAVAPSIDQYTGMPLGGLRDPAFSQLLESEREVQAKSCALLILEHLGEEGIAALPEVFQVSRDAGPLSAQARLVLQQLAETLSDRAHRRELPEVIHQLVLDYEQAPHPRGIELLARAPERASSALLNRFQYADAEKREVLGNALLHLDPSGYYSGDTMLRLVLDDDPQLVSDVLQLLVQMPSLYGEAVPRLLQLVSSKGEAHRGIVIEALLKMLSDPSAPRLHFAIADLTWAAGALASEDGQRRQLAVEVLRLTAPHSVEIEEQLEGMLGNSDKAVRESALRVFSGYRRVRDRSFARLVALLESPEPGAISVLSGLAERRPQVLSALTRFARTFGEYPQQLEAVADGVLRLGLGRDTGGFANLLAPAFQGFHSCAEGEFAESAVLRYLSDQQPLAEGLLLDALTSSSKGEKCASLYVLEQHTTLPRRVRSTVIELLESDDDSIAWGAARTLAHHGVLSSLAGGLPREVSRSLRSTIEVVAAPHAPSQESCKLAGKPVMNDSLARIVLDRCGGVGAASVEDVPTGVDEQAATDGLPGTGEMK